MGNGKAFIVYAKCLLKGVGLWVFVNVLFHFLVVNVFIVIYVYLHFLAIPLGFLGGSNGKECKAGDPGLIPGLGRSPVVGNGYPFQYSCLENSMDRGVCQTVVYGISKNRTQLKD